MDYTELMELFEQNYKSTVAFDKHMGMDLQVEAPGRVSYILEVKSHHLTAPNSAHGGVAAAMMDATLGVAALTLAITKGNLCATVEFKINYLRPVAPGNIMVSRGWVKHAGNRLIVSEGDIVEQVSSELVATGLGTFTQYHMEKRTDIQPSLNE